MAILFSLIALFETVTVIQAIFKSAEYLDSRYYAESVIESLFVFIVAAFKYWYNFHKILVSSKFWARGLKTLKNAYRNISEDLD